jgi:hypothetical protein
MKHEINPIQKVMIPNHMVTEIIESIRSRNPPCPGKELAKSLILFFLLIQLKNKSPSTDPIERITPTIASVTHHPGLLV